MRIIEMCKCQGCLRLYQVDIIIPDVLWEQIKPEGKVVGAGLLCGSCIINRIEKLGLYTAYKLENVIDDSTNNRG